MNTMKLIERIGNLFAPHGPKPAETSKGGLAARIGGRSVAAAEAGPPHGRLQGPPSVFQRLLGAFKIDRTEPGDRGQRKFDAATRKMEKGLNELTSALNPLPDVNSPKVMKAFVDKFASLKGIANHSQLDYASLIRASLTNIQSRGHGAIRGFQVLDMALEHLAAPGGLTPEGSVVADTVTTFLRDAGLKPATIELRN
ncbi:MAG: hypothetical protein ABIR26_13645 [Ramlibacter sp.]